MLKKGYAMRDYSKPPYNLSECAAAFVGLCNTVKAELDLNKRMSSLPVLGDEIYNLALSLQCPNIEKTGDLIQTAKNLQTLVQFVQDKDICKRSALLSNIDKELHKLPPHPFINYFLDSK